MATGNKMKNEGAVEKKVKKGRTKEKKKEKKLQ